MMELRQQGDIPTHVALTDVTFPESECRRFAAPSSNFPIVMEIIFSRIKKYSGSRHGVSIDRYRFGPWSPESSGTYRLRA
jgi:hypothetical protein